MKVQRARSEIAALDVHVAKQTGIHENHARLGVRVDPDTGFYEIYVSHVPDLTALTAGVSISVGVIVHLLRSALDNLVYQLALSSTGGQLVRPRDIYWPICSSEANFASRCKSGLAEVAAEDQQKIEQFQPYKGANGRPDSWSGPYVHQLDQLQELSNSDKHREFVYVSSSPNHFQLNRVLNPIHEAWWEWQRNNTREYLESFRPTSMQIGSRVFRPVPSAYAGPESTSVGFARAQLTLSELRPLIPTLNRLAEFVETVLDAFSVPTT